MVKDVAEEKLEEKPKNLKKLGLDEIALVKGHGNYCAVLVDLDKHKLIGILPSRKQEDLEALFQFWGEGVLEKIESVSIDLWKPYKSLIEKLIPQAEIIAERAALPSGVRFHVQKAINCELDTKRKELKRKANTKKNKSEKILKVIHNSKYPLLKNQSNLTEAQQDKLKQVKSKIPILGKMHAQMRRFSKNFRRKS